MESSASQIRVSSFQEATYLKAKVKELVEVIIEGILFKQIEPRLNDGHKKVFKKFYIIDDSAVDVADFNNTKAIKFIAIQRKLKIQKRKVVIITDNLSNYSDIPSHPRLKVLTPKDFIDRVNKFRQIIDEYDTLYGALYTAIFFPHTC